MFSFCPHCGGSIGQEQVPGQKLICRHCGQQIGVVTAAPQKVLVDRTEELIRLGTAARCPLCGQAVEVRAGGTDKTFVPHFATAPPRKMCPNSGKQVGTKPPADAPARTTSGGKDLSAFMTRDSIKLVSCARDAEPRIEELTLEYLDKSDRVRLQIEALRDILGPAFQMKAYPPQLHKTHLAVWGSSRACVVAKKHGQGGFQPLADAEITPILHDLRQHRSLFFP